MTSLSTITTRLPPRQALLSFLETQGNPTTAKKWIHGGSLCVLTQRFPVVVDLSSTISSPYKWRDSTARTQATTRLGLQSNVHTLPSRRSVLIKRPRPMQSNVCSTNTRTTLSLASDAKDNDNVICEHPPWHISSVQQVNQKGLPLLSRMACYAQDKSRICCYNDEPKDEHQAQAQTYHEIMQLSQRVHTLIQAKVPPNRDINRDPPPPRIAFLMPPSSFYIATLLGIWSCGCIAVPLCPTHPAKEMLHVLQDSTPSLIFLHEERLGVGANWKHSDCQVITWSDVVKLQTIEEELEVEGDQVRYLGGGGMVNTPLEEHPATILYTSGTTGKPKGVVTTHAALQTQIQDLIYTWKWTSHDQILHTLPLHHVHGLVNALLCPLWSGAKVEFMNKFNPARVWQRLAENKNVMDKGDMEHKEKQRQREGVVTLFMGVPTMYAKLLSASKTIDPSLLQRALDNVSSPSLQTQAASHSHTHSHSQPQPQPQPQPHSSFRVFISGSAALPTPIMQQWKNLTGHVILERYGMTEFAMALSNPYQESSSDERIRREGYVGSPLPSVQVCLVDEEQRMVHQGQWCGEGVVFEEPPVKGEGEEEGGEEWVGELRVKGRTVFKEYWNNPQATKSSFDSNHYFQTGDIAAYNPTLQSYRILGRASVDILKVGGYKLSALEIERVLLGCSHVEEVAVVGIRDDVYGQRVGAVCRLKRGELEEVKAWCEGELARYKIPTRWKVVVEEIPKNAMGKVNKKQLLRLFEEEE